MDALTTLHESTGWPVTLLLKITALLAVAWCGDRLARRANPRWRVLLWRAVAVGVVVTTVASVSVPAVTWRVLPAAEPAVSVATPSPDPILLIDHTNSMSAPPTAASGSSANLLQVLPGALENHTPPVESAQGLATNQTPTRQATAGESAKPRVANTTTDMGFPWRACLLAIWLVGVTVRLIGFALGVRRMRRVTAAASPVEESVFAAAEELARRCGVRGRLDVRHCDAAVAPCSTGLLRPVVLLPTEILQRDEKTETHGALAHELAHLAGRDLAWNTLLELLAAAFWFHPLVWRVRLAHVDACDERCDAVATGLTDDVGGYARLLARVALAVAQRAPSAALPMARTPHVLRRVRLLSLGRGRTRLRRGRALAAGLAIALASVAMGTITLDRQAAAAPPASDQQPAAEQATEQTTEPEAEPIELPPGQLRGRIVDKSGEPVTDAKLNLSGNGDGGYYNTTTDEDGLYAFDKIKESDTYRLRVESKGWIGLTDWRKLPQILLSPTSSVTRNLTLSRACLAHIRVVDEEGEPVRAAINVKNVAANSFSNSPRVVTDKFGWAEVGGLAPSVAAYRFGVSSDGHSYGKVELKLTEAGKATAATVRLKKGATVRGVITCSDGKPPTGWKLYALPNWWKFGIYPKGVEVGPEGEFAIPNIAPGKYNLLLFIPTGDGMSTSRTILSDAQLPRSEGLLRLKANVPSPGGRGTISGKLVFSGVSRKGSISIEAWREGDQQYGGSAQVGSNETEFSLEALPPGKYKIDIQSTEIETVTLRNIEVPTKGLEIPVEVRGKPRLIGQVLNAAGEPVTSFRARVTKVRYTRGPGYVQSPTWITVNDPEGRFSLETVGPGVYRVTVAAEGTAQTTSDPLNTDALPDKPVTLTLGGGVTLRGRVVDEAGRPVAGATVAPRSASGTVYPRTARVFVGEEGAVTTSDDGKFELTGLPAGEELLRVSHPDYVFALSEETTLADEDKNLPPITLRRGGSVSGVAYDGQGDPRAGVMIIFHDSSGYGGGGDELLGRLGEAVTDEQGRYTVTNLPERLCYVHLDDEWDKRGVVRTAILPADGEERTLDLGGPGGFVGRLLINGEPAANQRLQLSGDNSSFGTFRSFSRTDDAGRFALSRPPAGKRMLWVQPGGRQAEWQRVTEVAFPPSAEPGAVVNLGDVDHRTVDVRVSASGVEQEEREKLRVFLRGHHPKWFSYGVDLGDPVPRTSPEGPYAFRGVTMGRAVATLYHESGVSLSKTFEVTGSDATQEETIVWPEATGTLVVNVAPDLLEDEGQVGLPKVRSVDGNVAAYLRNQPDAKPIRIERLPAGDYYLTHQDTRHPKRLLEFRIEQGETTTLDLNRENGKYKPSKQGFVLIRWFDSEGVPLRGVEGGLGETGVATLFHVTHQDAAWSCAGPPGAHQVLAKLEGFEPLAASVTIKPPGPDGEIVDDVTVDLFMRRAE